MLRDVRRQPGIPLSLQLVGAGNGCIVLLYRLLFLMVGLAVLAFVLVSVC